jgi:hypothetical protein
VFYDFKRVGPRVKLRRPGTVDCLHPAYFALRNPRFIAQTH